MSSRKSGLRCKYEIFSIDTRYRIVHLRVHDAHGGLRSTTSGGDTLQRAYRLWRDTDFLWQLDRDRLQVPV